MKRLKSAPFSALIVACCSSLAFAQSEQTIVSSVNSVLKIVVAIVGPSVLSFGLIRAFVAHSAGDEDGMRSARNAVVGGLGILFTFTLVKLIVAAAGVAY